MKLMNLLIAALLAFALVVSLGSIVAPNFNMFSSPSFSIYHTGFNQLSPTSVGKTPILFSPSTSQMFSNMNPNMHFMPKLETGTWTSSMKTSGVNQMFALLSKGIGSKKKT